MTIFRLTPNDDSDSRVEVNRSLIDGPTVTFVNIRQGDERAAAWLTATETRAVIAALQATLPAEEAPATPDRHKVSTAADLDALPVGAKVEDREGDVWTRAESRRWVLGLRPALAAGLPIIPATFLPGTLLNPEILDAEPEPTTAATLRLDLRLFLGDRDITYALSNPIADALEG